MEISWQNIFHVWEKAHVRHIEAVEFDASFHFSGRPWVQKRNQQYPFPSSSVQDTSARHLINLPILSTPEGYAAFAIYTYLLQIDVYFRKLDFDLLDLRIPIWKFFEEAGLDVDFWAGNAKNAFPRIKGFPKHSIDLSWENVVSEAAECWNAISETYVLVKVPSTMQIDSPEWRKWHGLTV